MTITACLIVKNEVANLPRCLDSLAGKVDEIIICDTGSTDDTFSLATRLAPKVAREWAVQKIAWRDDFAAARNESIRHALSPWILWIDADEELLEARAGAFKAAVAYAERKRLPGYAVSVEHLKAEGPPEVIPCWKLFRNGEGFHFEGRVHEQVKPERDLFCPDTFWIRHHGFKDADLLREKQARDMRLLERALLEHPDDPYVKFNIACIQRTMGYPLLAQGWLSSALRAWERLGRPDVAYKDVMLALADELGAKA